MRVRSNHSKNSKRCLWHVIQLSTIYWMATHATLFISTSGQQDKGLGLGCPFTTATIFIAPRDCNDRISGTVQPTRTSLIYLYLHRLGESYCVTSFDLHKTKHCQDTHTHTIKHKHQPPSVSCVANSSPVECVEISIYKPSIWTTTFGVDGGRVSIHTRNGWLWLLRHAMMSKW